MSLVTRFRNFFRGGETVSNVKELTTLLEHPKIQMEQEEYSRIQESLRLYRGQHKNVSYLNSRGNWKNRPRRTINTTKMVANTLASVVFNENCKISIEGEAQGYIDQLFADVEFNKTFREYLEPMFALGGLAVRPYADVNDNYKMKYSWALADAFFPLTSNSGEIRGCVMPFKTTRMEGKKRIYYTKLEIHEWEDGTVKITNELYKSENPKIVGKQVPLSQLGEDLEPTSEVENVSRPQFTYLKPAGFNNINPHSPLGLGATDNCRDTVEQINETYDQFSWEMKLTEAKIAVSSHMTKVGFDNNGAPIEVFDDTTNVFVPLRGEMDTPLVQDLTRDIRSRDYIRSINKFFSILETETKLSAGTYEMDDSGVVKTATEVISEDSKTYKTRSDQLTNVENFIKGIIVSTLELASGTVDDSGQTLYNGVIPTFEDIAIDFDDGVFTDKNTKMKHYGELVDKNLIPKLEAIQRIMGVTEQQAREWLHQIRIERVQHEPGYANGLIQTSLFGREVINELNEELENDPDET